MKINYIKRKNDLISNKKRVAAYARVSNAKNEMLHSLNAQISFYTNLIKRNKDWEYAGVYADEGITGTKESRPEFQKLLQACKEGKIDIILTKSLSRFSRNTLTTLKTIRQLKEYGVDVWFERENIHSLSGDGEFMLTILASIAQEESLSASENQKWKIRKNFKEGKPTPTRMTGYIINSDKFEIIPNEAETVKLIFDYYLSGMGFTAICKKLMADNIPTKNGKQWYEKTIKKILTNEKYVGDLLLQKTYSKDHLSKKTMINNGELPKYFIKDDHKPIIDRETFDLVQDEIKRRSIKYAHNVPTTGTYEFTGKIICDKCGKHYRRKKLSSGKVVWICTTFNRLGKAYCPSQQIPEDILKALIGKTEFTKIHIPCANTVVIVTSSGEKITKEWEYPSRKDSWTPKMKDKAREKGFELWQKKKLQ